MDIISQNQSTNQKEGEDNKNNGNDEKIKPENGKF